MAMTASRPIDFSRRYRVSHHAQIRFTSTGASAESLITGKSRRLNAVAARVLLSLMIPVSLDELMSRLAPAHRSAAKHHVIQCIEDGLVTEISTDGKAAEDEILALRGWEHHDLAFHLRSRRGRAGARAGATWHRRGVLPAE